MTIGQRLQDALRRRTKSLRWLSVTLTKRKVKGASYASVHSYVNGDTTPGLGFLNAAADALSVRRAWLIQGEGLPDEEVQRSGVQVLPRWESHQLHVQALEGTIPQLADVPGVIQVAFLEVLRRFIAGMPTRRVTREQYQRAAVQLWRFVDLPEQVAGFRASFASDDFISYALAMLQALLLGMPEPGKGNLSRTSLAEHFGAESQSTRRLQ